MEQLLEENEQNEQKIQNDHKTPKSAPYFF